MRSYGPPIVTHLLTVVSEDKRPMGAGQERVNRIVRLVEAESMGARLGPYRFNPAHRVRLEDFDQPRVPNGHVGPG